MLSAFIQSIGALKDTSCFYVQCMKIRLSSLEIKAVKDKMLLTFPQHFLSNVYIKCYTELENRKWNMRRQKAQMPYTWHTDCQLLSMEYAQHITRYCPITTFHIFHIIPHCPLQSPIVRKSNKTTDMCKTQKYSEILELYFICYHPFWSKSIQQNSCFSYFLEHPVTCH